MVLDEDWIICKPLGNIFVRVKRNNKGISPTCYRKNNVYSKNMPFGKRSKPKRVKELGYKFLVSILHDWREGLKPLRFLVKCLHWKGSLQRAISIGCSGTCDRVKGGILHDYYSRQLFPVRGVIYETGWVDIYMGRYICRYILGVRRYTVCTGSRWRYLAM